MHTVPKKEVTMILSFLGTCSYNVKKNLDETLRKLLPFCKLRIIFRTTSRMSSYFSFKGKFPKSLMSGVIYKYTCSNCNVSYIGCTARYWEKRLEEHTHLSALTGKPLSGVQVFAPLQHVKTAKCNPSGPKVTRDDFEVIGYERDRYLLQLKESILIKKENPVINGNITSVPLHLFA